MSDQDLKKLSRAELLELLVIQSKEIESLRSRLDQAEAKLVSRDIAIADAGSIAEAALTLNNVFAAAEAASQQYLDNVRLLCQKQEAACAQKERACREMVAVRLAETEQNCATMEAQTKRKCDEMIATAQIESQAYWDDLSARLDAFYKEHQGLRELLALLPK